MPPTELQKRILELSSSLVATDDADEFQHLASELRKALREHTSKLRAIVGETRNNIVRRAGISRRDRNSEPAMERGTRAKEDLLPKESRAARA